MKKAIKNTIKNFLSFTQRERIGFFVIVFLIMVVTIWPYLITPKVLPPSNFDSFDSLAHLLNNNEIVEQKIQPENIVKEKFHFNPNVINEQGLMDLGFSNYLAKRIVNFRSKGGVFYKPSDLYKIYGVDSVFIEQLLPYVELPIIQKGEMIAEKNNGNKLQNTNYKSPINSTKIDINLADTTDLKKVYGIGSKLSKRIILYRNKLGGFYSFSQLNEVWGLNIELVESIKNKFELNPGYIQKININTVDKKALEQHPYVGYKTAQSIDNFKKQHGSFNTINDLNKIISLKDSVIFRLNNYFMVK